MRLSLLAGHRRPARTPAPTDAFVRVTENTEVMAHLVREVRLVESAGGSVTATCGQDFLPASMTAPDPRLCTYCDDLIKVWGSASAPSTARRWPP